MKMEMEMEMEHDSQNLLKVNFNFYDNSAEKVSNIYGRLNFL